MENNSEKTTKMFTESDLTNLRNALPGKYYPEFQSTWVKNHGNKTKCPSKQNVSMVANGHFENDKILEVLIELVEKRNELKQRLVSANKYAREPEAATAD
jgi:hypothetical protein